MIKKLLFFLSVVFSINTFATHVIGGTLTYEYMGGSTYKVMLRLYRDCTVGNAAFPASMTIQVRDSNGVAFSPSKNFNIPFPGATQLLQNWSCVTNPNICLEEAVYTQVVNNFPAQAGGYHLYTQYCCRSAALVNVANPLASGDSWNTFIPDANIYLQNSSPQWVSPPPVYGCVNSPVGMSFQAADADGDSLVHSWYTPYSDPAPTFPGNWIAFTPIAWVSGYSQNNPCGGPNWIINPTTGAVIGTPPNIGIFIIGVKVEEYRNGIKIGEIVRDWNFNIINCGPPPVASFTTQDTICLSGISSFMNTSTGDSTNYWDFGVISSSNDTSTFSNPNYTYPSIGNYIVMLIINPGQGFCTDTAFDTVTVQNCVGINEIEKWEINLSPNPATENILLQLKNTNGSVLITIEDITGKILFSKEENAAGEVTETISVQELSKGIYFVKAKCGNQLITEKLIVK